MRKLICNNTLDGLLCNIIANILIKDLECVVVDNNTVGRNVIQMISNKTYKKYEKIYICNIGIDWGMAGIINMSQCKNLKLLDVNDYDTWLNNYEWATVESIYKTDRKISTTKLLFEELLQEDSSIKNNPKIKLVNEIIAFTNDYYFNKKRLYTTLDIEDFRYILKKIGFEALSKIIIDGIKNNSINTIQDIFNYNRNYCNTINNDILVQENLGRLPKLQDDKLLRYDGINDIKNYNKVFICMDNGLLVKNIDGIIHFYNETWHRIIESKVWLNAKYQEFNN